LIAMPRGSKPRAETIKESSVMRLSSLLLTCATASLLGVAAAAQEAAPPTGAPAKAEPTTGLSGLQDTVSQLRDEQQAENPNQSPPAPATESAAPPPPAAEPAPEPHAAPAPTTEAAPAPPAQPPVRALTGPPQPVSRAETAQLTQIVARGRLIGSIARAGQLATQDMLAHVPDPNAAGISGWIAMPEGNGTTVTFYTEGAEGAAPAAVYRANVLGGRVVSRETYLTATRPPLAAIEARMARARHATDALDHQACGGQDFNVFVVPPTTPTGPIDVYQFSAQTQRGHFPVGGHFKTTIASDGTVSASHAVAAACRDVTASEVVAGRPAAPIEITADDAPLPTEAHVFMTMWTGHPLVVTTGDPARRFAVGSENITDMTPH
jgi:outer membrane biosynthesis protein TonB